MSMYLYMEINFICIFILGLIAYKVQHDTIIRLENKLFTAVLVSSIVTFAQDILWALIDGNIIPASITANAYLNAWYMIQVTSIGYFWFMYVEEKMNPLFLQRRQLMFCLSIPFFVLVLMSLASVSTGWIFYIDENNAYHRGPLYLYQVFTIYGYIFISAWRGLNRAVNETSYVKKQENLTMSTFAILPLAGGIIQTLCFGMPTLCVGITLSILSVYLTLQERQISLDHLTQLNNRNQLSKFLSVKLNDIFSNDKFFLIMIDVDKFKVINDVYGHLEGDNALIEVANVLKKVFGRYDSFIARYGGDEFVIVQKCVDEAQLKAMQAEIKAQLAITNRERPYAISLSMGWSECTKELKNVKDIIAKADTKLYTVKKNRK